MNKLILFLFVFAMIPLSVLGIPQPVVYHDFDGNNFSDKTPNNYDSTNVGTTNTSGIRSDGRDASGSAQGVLLANLTGENYETILLWVNPDVTVGTGAFQMLLSDSTGNNFLALGGVTGSCSNEVITLLFDANRDCWNSGQIANLTAGTWHKVMLVWNTTTTRYDLWVNNTNYGQGAQISGTGEKINSTEFSGDGLYIANYLSGTDFNGQFDEFSVWNSSLTVGNISALQTRFYPYELNESLESTLTLTQSGSVTINNPNFQTILDSQFNISINNSPAYAGYSFNVNPFASNTLFCEVLIDGVSRGNITRSNTINEVGSVFLQTDVFYLDEGVHNETLRCNRQSGGGSFSINNTEGVTHILVDAQNNTLNFTSFNLTQTATSGASPTKLGGFNFTISDVDTLSLNKSLIIDWKATYTNNDASSELLNSYVSVNGSNCQNYPRTVSSGSTGSVAGGCVFNNLTSNATYEVLIYGNGTNAEYTHKVIAKEYVSGINEVFNQSLQGISFNGSEYVSLLNITQLNNQHHAEASVFTKLGIPLSSNQSTSVSFYVNITNSQTLQSVISRRTVTSDVGVLIFQHVFKNLGIGNYTVELFGKCGGNTCDLKGGEVLLHLTDVTETTDISLFNVTVLDNFDNSSINGSVNIELSGGSVFTTSDDWIIINTNKTLENLTISVGNNDYFNVTYLNVNTSEPFTAYINQTLLSWDCFEKVSLKNVTCLSPAESELFNYNIKNNPHNQSVNVTGYYELIDFFNVTPLQTGKLNASVYSTNLSLRAISSLGSVSSCSYNITSLNYSFVETVTGSPNTTVGLTNGSFSILADCTDYAFSTLNITIENLTQNLTFNLLSTNSINISFFDEDLPTVPFTERVDFSLIGPVTNNYTNSSGFSYLTNLTIGDYEIRYSANIVNETWDDRSIFFTLTNRSAQTLDLFLSETNETTNYIIRVADQSDSDVVDAKVLLQRQYIEFDGDFKTIEECKTNTDGECDMHIQESSSIVYRFVVVIDGEIVKTTQNENIVNVAGITTKQITIRISTGTSFLDSYTDIKGLFGNVIYDNETKTANYSFVDSQNSITAGCLFITRYGFANATPTFLESSCVSDTNGDITINVSAYILNGTTLNFDGIINYTDSYLLLDRETLSTSDRGANYDEDNALLITLMGFIVVSFATILIPNALIQVVINLGLLYGLSFFGFNLIPLSVILLLMSVGLFVNYTKKNTEEVQVR